MATVKLCAFADEASKSLDGQIEALKRNGIYAIELRGVDGTNIADLTDEQAKIAADKPRAEKPQACGVRRLNAVFKLL